VSDKYIQNQNFTIVYVLLRISLKLTIIKAWQSFIACFDYLSK